MGGQEWKKEEENLYCLISKKICDFLDNKIDRLYSHCYKENEVLSYRFFYEMDGNFYSEKEIFSLFQYDNDYQQREFRMVLLSCNKYWDDLFRLWNDNSFYNCMETKTIYDIRTNEIDIFHSVNFPKDTRYYEYVTDLWLNELREANGQELTGIYIDEYILRKTEFKNNQRCDWQKLFSSCLGKMITMQLACNQYVVGDDDWQVDFNRGVIRFGERIYPIQYIGSESNITETWLWAWNNINQFDEALLQLAYRTKKCGEEQQIPQLATDELELSDAITGHNMATIACGMQTEPTCYYRCTHDAGAAYVAFRDMPKEVYAPIDADNFVEIAVMCLRNYPFLNHRIFIQSFLNWNKTAYSVEDDCIIAHFEQPVKISYVVEDDEWRITQIEM